MKLNAMQKEAFLASLEKVIKDKRKETRKECDELAIKQLENDTYSNTLNIAINGNKIGVIRITDASEEIAIKKEVEFKKWAKKNLLGNEWVEEVTHFDLSPTWQQEVTIKDGHVIDNKTGEILDFLEVKQTPPATKVYSYVDGICPVFNSLGDDTMPQLLGGE